MKETFVRGCGSIWRNTMTMLPEFTTIIICAQLCIMQLRLFSTCLVSNREYQTPVL